MTKNIVFLNTHYNWGGGENWTLLTANGLKKRGHNVWIAGRKDSAIIKRAKTRGFKTKIINLHNTLSTINPFKINSFKNFLISNNIDVLFLNLSRDRKFGAITGTLAGVNQIIYTRGLDKPLKKRFYSNWLYNKAITDIITHSQSTKSTITKSLKDIIDSDKVQVIHHGVEIPKNIKPNFSLRKDYSIKENQKILVNLGRLSPEKDHKLLLKAMSELNKLNTNWKLFIIGEGEEKENILKNIQKYNLKDQIFLTGFVNNVNEYLIQADLMVHSAKSEGFGLVLIEAMAIKLPVVAVSVSDIPNIVKNGEVGFLAEKNNPKDLAIKINTLLLNNSLREQMSSKTQEYVQKNFSINHMIEQYENLIN